MYKKILAALFVLCIALPVCAKRQSEEIITPMAQLQKRQFQTRTFSANTETSLMKGVLNVLQDEGYIVYNVNSVLGFIYGVKDFDTTDPNVDISKEFGLTKSRLSYNGVKVATLEFVANVTPYPDNTKIRINFKRKLLNEYGNAQFIDDVDDAEFYEEFYNKLDTALSLQKNGAVKKQTKQEIQISTPPKAEPEVIPETVEQTVVEDTTQPQKTEVVEEVVESVPAEQVQEEEISENITAEDDKEAAKLEKKRAKEEAKALKEQEKLEKELEKEKAKQAKEQAKIEKELNKIYQ